MKAFEECTIVLADPSRMRSGHRKDHLVVRLRGGMYQFIAAKEPIM
jgi:hypothetical protein